MKAKNRIPDDLITFFLKMKSKGTQFNKRLKKKLEKVEKRRKWRSTSMDKDDKSDKQIKILGL